MSYLESTMAGRGPELPSTADLAALQQQNFEGEAVGSPLGSTGEAFAPQNNRIRLTPMPIPEDP